MESTFCIGNRNFTLDQEKAMEAFIGKKVINGREAEAFNLLPLKYPWAYDVYRKLKNANWSPFSSTVVDLIKKDQEDRENPDLVPIMETVIGFFAPRELAAEAVLNSLIREKVTAPELKLVLGRKSHEENITTDCFLFLSDRLHVDPVECTSRYHDFASTREIMEHAEGVARSVTCELDLATVADKQRLARAILFLGPCFKGVQFSSLFVTMLAISREGRFPAVAEIMRRRMRDEGLLTEFLRRLFRDLVKENPEIQTPAFEQDLVDLMKATVEREKDFARECLAFDSTGIEIGKLHQVIEHIAGRRLHDLGFKSSLSSVGNPFPWLTDLCFSKDFPDLTELSPIEAPVSDSEL